MSQRSSTKSNIIKLPLAKQSIQGITSQTFLNDNLSPQNLIPQTGRQSNTSKNVSARNSQQQFSVKQSERNFHKTHHLEGHQALEKALYEYQISAFAPQESLKKSVDSINRLISNDSLIINNLKQFEVKEDLLNDSCTPFSKLIGQEKLMVDLDIEQSFFINSKIYQDQRVSMYSKNSEYDYLEMVEEGTFARNPRVSLGFYNEKPKPLIERNKILQEGPLFGYNEAKINDLSMQIFKISPILDSKKIHLQFDDPIFKNTLGDQKQIYNNLSKFILNREIQSREQQFLNVYNSIIRKIKSFENLVSFLVDEFVECQNAQISQEEYFNQIKNEIAKKTILATQEEIKDGCFNQVLSEISSLKNQSVNFCKRINQLISLCDQQVNENKDFQVLNANKCTQMKFEFQKAVQETSKQFEDLLFNQTYQLGLQNLLKKTYEYFINDNPQSIQNQIVRFVLEFPLKINELYDNMILIVQSIQITMLKVYESQIDNFRSIKKFYQNLQNNLNQLEFLFDFSQLKFPKYLQKIKIIRNILNQIQLPYKNYQQQNDNVLLEFYKKLSKLKAKWQVITKKIIKLCFNDQSGYVFVHQLQTVGGRQFLLFEYMGFRNSLIKNPRKFNYSLIIDRPMLLLQKVDELIKIENQIKAQSVVLDNLTEIYQTFKNFPQYEEKLEYYQAVRIKIRSHLESDNPEILRLHTQDSLNEFSGLVNLLHEISTQIPVDENYRGSQISGFQEFSDLPEQFIRLKEWILCEIDQLNHHKTMIAQIALNTKEQKEGLESISSLKLSAKKIIEKIDHLIQIDPEPSQVRQIWDKYKKGADKESKLVVIFDKDQEQATYQVYVKFLLELFNNKENTEKPKGITDDVDNTLGEISKICDLPKLEKSKKEELLRVYSELSQTKQKYSIWEHICASRFLVDSQLLNEMVGSMQIIAEGGDESPLKQSTQKMEKLQNMIKKHQTFFEVNQINPKCMAQKKYLVDVSKYLNLLSNNFQTLTNIVEENKKSQNKIDIEKFMQDLMTSVQTLFKDKDFSLGSQKDEISKCIKAYVGDNIAQSKIVEKGTEFLSLFEKMDEFMNQTLIVYFDKTLEIFKEIFKTDFLKQKEIHNPKFKMKQKNTLSSYEEFNDCFQIKKNLNGSSQVITQFKNNFIAQKKSLKPKELLDFQIQLTNRIDSCNQILLTCDLFDLMSELTFKVGVQLNDVLVSTTKKWESFFQMNATKNLIEIFQQQIGEISTLLKKTNDFKKIFNEKKFQNEFIMYSKIDQFVSNIQKLGDQIAKIFASSDKLIDGFQIITQGFAKYFDQIDVMNPNFFVIVNYWLAFYQGKKNNQLPTEICFFDEVSSEIQELIEKIKNFAPSVKGNISFLINQIIKYIDTYQTYFNADFLQTLNYFENDFYSGDEKIQNFNQFSKDLLFILNVSDNQKDTIRNALKQFYNKNKLSDAPLRRMNLFIKAVLGLQADKRMAQQKKLNKVLNIEEIFKKMGEGLLELWINMCQQMDECLRQYWEDVEKQELKDKSHYISKIEDQEYNLNDDSLKLLSEKFVNLLLLDYDLSKVY